MRGFHWLRLEKHKVAKFQIVVALLLTLVALALHARVWAYAGPLWRDEISSVRLATASWKEFWALVVPDVFPASYFLLLRGWIAAGLGTSDFGFRFFGFIWGSGLLAALWISCRIVNKSAPIWPLALFALNPLTFQCGDQLRPHGLGAISIVLTFAFIWQLVFQEPRRPATIVCAALAALVSVQTVYTNALLVFAICSAGIVVTIGQKAFRVATTIFAVGVFAALSLLPYLVNFRRTHIWLALLPGAESVSEVLEVLLFALSRGHWLAQFAWILLALLGIAVAFGWPRPVRGLDDSPTYRHQVLFAIIVLFVGTTITIIFFRVLHWQNFSRYFWLLMAVGSLCLHVFSEVLQRRKAVMLLSLLGAVTFAFLQVPSTYRGAGVRVTNCDLVARAIAERATPNDVVVLTGFWYGLSFHRYYHGAAPWRTVPDIADYTWYRWDLVMNAMGEPDPMRDILTRIEFALRSGHKVFLAGRLVSPPTARPKPLPPAPHSSYGWQLSPYIDNWQQQIAYLLEQNAKSGEEIPLGLNQPVEVQESIGVFVVSGWQDAGVRSTTP